MNKLIALAGLAAYTVQSPLDHDGKRYPVGAPIQLDTKAAQDLLDMQVIGHADANAAQALQTGQPGQAQQQPGQADAMAALLASLEDAKAQRDQAREEVERLRAQLGTAQSEIISAKADADNAIRGLQQQLQERTQLLTDAKADADTLQAQLADATTANAELTKQLEVAKAAAAKTTGKRT